MFPHDAYSGTNGLLMPFVGVECDQLKSRVNSGRHTKKIDNYIIELSYRIIIAIFLIYRIVYRLKTVFDIL